MSTKDTSTLDRFVERLLTPQEAECVGGAGLGYHEHYWQGDYTRHYDQKPSEK